MELLARTCKSDEMNWQRFAGRAMVVLGGVFWVAWIFGARWGIQNDPFLSSLGASLPPLIAVIAVFVVSLYYERLAGYILFGVAAAVIVWGIVMTVLGAAWPPVVWGVMFLLYMLPALVAGAFFLLAARMEQICEAPRS